MNSIHINDIIAGMNAYDFRIFPRKNGKGTTITFANPASPSGRTFVDRRPVGLDNAGQSLWGWLVGNNTRPQAQVSATVAPTAQIPSVSVPPTNPFAVPAT